MSELSGLMNLIQFPWVRSDWILLRRPQHPSRIDEPFPRRHQHGLRSAAGRLIPCSVIALFSKARAANTVALANPRHSHTATTALSLAM